MSLEQKPEKAICGGWKDGETRLRIDTHGPLPVFANNLERFRYIWNRRVHDVHRHGGVFGERGHERQRLDLIGDMALVGVRIKGHITAYKTGHEDHVMMAQKLRMMYQTAEAEPNSNPTDPNNR